MIKLNWWDQSEVELLNSVFPVYDPDCVHVPLMRWMTIPLEEVDTPDDWQSHPSPSKGVGYAEFGGNDRWK